MDIIKQKPYDPLETRLTGELAVALDQPLLAVGAEVVPLDLPLLPRKTLGGPEVRIIRDGAVVHEVLQAGGGGLPTEAIDWTFPGCAPSLVEEDFLTSRTVALAFNYPTRIHALRLRVITGSADLSVRLYDADGVQVYTDSITVNGAGTYMLFPDLTLEPGFYTQQDEADGTVLLETIQTVSPWLAGIQRHVAALGVRRN